MTKIVVDMMGSDAGPEMAAEGVAQALAEDPAFEVVLVGPKTANVGLLSSYRDRIEWIETEEYISNEEKPVLALRRKKEASIVLALNRLNEDDCDGALTAGSTGALISGAYFITRRIPGVDRCGLAVQLPGAGGGTILCDTGATVDASPKMILQFAEMASEYAKVVKKVDRPRVGLLNIGAEKDKGNKASNEAYGLLEASSLNFIGNVEPRYLLNDRCDVLAADGFDGNLVLKTLEGTGKTLMTALKSAFYHNTRTKLGALLLKDQLKQELKDFDYQGHGGAPLLGARKALYKAHGNSNAETFALAVHEAVAYAESRIVDKIHVEEE